MQVVTTEKQFHNTVSFRILVIRMQSQRQQVSGSLKGQVSLKGYCETKLVSDRSECLVLCLTDCAHLVSPQKAEYELIDSYLKWVRYIR